MCGIFCEIYNCQRTISKDEKLLNCIRRRGPDCKHEINLEINSKWSLYMFGCVLWMQGEEPIKQPLESDKGLLLFNGDIFNGTWGKESDTVAVLNILDNAKSTEHLLTQLKTLKGPFSLIYYNKHTKNIYFLRDRIGRNSLLCHKSENSYVISNVLGRKYPCSEVSATHIYELDINGNKITLHSWDVYERPRILSIEDWFQSCQEQQSIPDEDFCVAFDSSLVLNEMDSIITYIENVSLKNNNKQTIFERLLDNEVIFDTVRNICKLLEKSVQVRVQTQPNKCKGCITNEHKYCNHCTTGILFSGGLDCTILAYLSDKYLPKEQPIDLINVAFKSKDNCSYDVPDRITGRQSYKELQRLCPSRLWVFHEVNVAKEKLEEYQLSIIGDLVYPRKTILDESLGSALWFAAGAGELTHCRVLLLGSGADELFGGYVRHRNAYKRQGWLGLSKELLLDWKRISFRNLARDNRVICDHGRQPRMPYLDEDLTDYVLNLKPWLKCYPSESLPCGIGDKLILRLVAHHLGFVYVTSLPKRALQFGSRIANKKEKGSDISKTFMNTQNKKREHRHDNCQILTTMTVI